MKQLIHLMQRGESDASRYKAGIEFDSTIHSFLLDDSMMLQPTSFAPNISCVQPSDQSWRLLTWIIPSYEGDQYFYFGYLQKKGNDQTGHQLYRLSDSTSVIRKPESEKLTPDRWLGATYYEVIPNRRKGKSFYTLCGWKGKDKKVTQKVIEVLYFDKAGAKFGMPVFKKQGVFKSRIIFSFTSQASMSLRYESSKKAIVFDHLYLPKQNGVADPSQAGPDGSYDGYKFKRGRWIWIEDIKMKVKVNSRH